MYQQFPLDPTCDRNRSVPSYYVGIVEEATRKISKSHTHHAKGMVSVPQSAIRSHVNTTELEFNHNKPVRISHIYFYLFKQHEYYITCIYVCGRTP